VLSVVVSGVITGLLFALTGQGLVVVYRTTKVLNFALGGMGVVVAYIAYEMLRSGVPYWVVMPVAVALGGVLGGLIELLVVRPLKSQPVLTISIATLGVLLVLEGLVGWKWGFQPTSLPPAFADAGTLRMGAALALSANQIFILVIAVVATAGLLFLVERTRLGLSMRATTSGPVTAQLLGIDVERVRRAGWIIGGAYGCLAAMLVTPLTYLSPTSFLTFLITAFAAVVLGGFTSIVGVVLGAVAFGVGTNLLVVYLQEGLIATYTFIGVALILVFRPHGIFGRVEREVSEPDLSRKGASATGGAVPAPGRIGRLLPGGGRLTKALGWGVLAVVLALVPGVATSTEIYLVASILATFVAVVGLNIVTGFNGQVSLGTSGFAAAGAYAAAISLEEGLNMPLALAVATVAGGLAGLIIGVTATRLSGIYLGLLTLLFAIAVPEMVAHFKSITGGVDGKIVMAEAFATPESQYWLTYVIAAAAAALAIWLGSSRVGRNWRAVRDSERGARALGLNPARVKLGAFVLSSSLAGVSGALLGMLTAFIAPESFGLFFGIYVLLAVVLGGAGSVAGSLAGAAFIVWVPQNTGDLPTPLIFGAVLLLVMLVAPTGLSGLGARVASLISRRRGVMTDVSRADASRVVVTEPDMVDAPATPTVAAAAARTDDLQPAHRSALLALDGVSAGYGAGLVLRGLSLHVKQGEVVTLLGANGAGKSTVLRAVSGLIPLAGGQVTWLGEPIGAGRLSDPHQIARSGLAHVPEGRGIFPDLSVMDNLRLGRFADLDKSQSAFEADLDRVVTYFPVLKQRLKQLAGTLSGGEQQMLAIGRALVGSPKLLMLDEPSLGLSPLFTQQVLDNLRLIADQGEVSVLLIEQNARAALDMADRAYVIARGEVVMEGSPESLLGEHDLSELYLAVKV
jgi:ABC-type branched-subunit amino acid transport system ATPase component/ABC-type branched-subunit amino acid transport system permease subunit